MDPGKSQARAFALKKLLNGNYSKIYLPAAGRLAVAEAYVKNGGSASRVFASDPGLIASSLGLLLKNKSLLSLGIRLPGEIRECDGAELLGQLVVFSKLMTFNATHLFGSYRRKEIILNWSDYLARAIKII